MVNNYPNNFPSDGGITACIVTGGHINEPSPDESHDLKVIDPIRHGPNINHKDLPFVSSIRSATQADLETCNPPPEPGTCVYVMSTTGEPSGRVVLGQPNGQNNSQSSPGNLDLLSFWAQIEQQVVGKTKSEGFQTKSRGGAEVREPKDGEEWKHILTRGLPTHAALFPMAGTVLPAIKQIETAIQQFSGILNSNMLSQLPGQLMSLSSLFNKMNSGQKSKAKQNMRPEVSDAFDSMMNLIQTADAPSGFASGMRVNEEVFLENAADLLSQVNNLSDLSVALQKIQNDTNLRGLEQLPKAKVESESAFGTFSYEMDAEGNLEFDDIDSNTANISVSTLSSIYTSTSNTSNVNIAQTSSSGGGGNQQVLQSIQQFVGQMTNLLQNSGASTADNLFKDQAQKMSELMGRIPTDASKAMLADMNKAMAGFHPTNSLITKSKVPFGQLAQYFTGGSGIA
jgi:hypothetical protein